MYGAKTHSCYIGGETKLNKIEKNTIIYARCPRRYKIQNTKDVWNFWCTAQGQQAFTSIVVCFANSMDV